MKNENIYDWQVGDRVYAVNYNSFGTITHIHDKLLYPVRVKMDNKDVTDAGYGFKGNYFTSKPHQLLFHLDAVTFDNQGRPLSFDYDFRPEREPKVKVTKLPHEFEKGEEVFVKDSIQEIWKCIANFKEIHIEKEYPYYTEGNGSWKYCIPYKGNEHCEGKVTNCESGKIPEDYVFPEKPPFADVKVGDTLYRLEDGKYIKGTVVFVNSHDSIFGVETDEETSFKNTESTIWNYDLDGMLAGQEDIGQVIFKEIPESEDGENCYMQTLSGIVEKFAKVAVELYTDSQQDKECTLKPFDKVLVRESDLIKYQIDLFQEYRGNVVQPYRCLNGAWKYCIPYEGNEHLLKSTEPPKEDKSEYIEANYIDAIGAWILGKEVSVDNLGALISCKSDGCRFKYKNGVETFVSFDDSRIDLKNSTVWKIKKQD